MEQRPKPANQSRSAHTWVEYDLSAIRTLITEAFTARDLWRFCQERPSFQPALIDFGYNASLGEMTDTLIEHCRTKLLLADLLAEIQRVNPKQYTHYCSQLDRTSPLGKEPSKQPQVLENLPNRDYGRFVGREEELAQIRRILRPYPHSQEHLVTIDGVGGIGKSALALEVAYCYTDKCGNLPEEERFQAIVWTSARTVTLTANGIAPRPQITRQQFSIWCDRPVQPSTGRAKLGANRDAAHQNWPYRACAPHPSVKFRIAGSPVPWKTSIPLSPSP